jgi:ectoine hydroxylase-related dioxygenase (phytanoyl-CoA dioxygenase family)
MDEAKRHQLDSEGFCVLPGFMGAEFLEALRQRVEDLFASEGASAGSEFKQEPGARRLANLVDKGEVFERSIVMDEVLEGVEHVLGAEYKLSSLNVRVADPNEGGLQPLHIDMGWLPDSKGFATCNTVWMLDDFTPQNGALRVVPGSHKWGKRPQDVLDDANANHPEEQLVTGKAGDVVVVNAATWHGGTLNCTDRPRRAMHGFYVRRDVPQQQYQKQLLRPDTQARLSPELRRVLALDDPMNDELCASGMQLSGFMK